MFSPTPRPPTSSSQGLAKLCTICKAASVSPHLNYGAASCFSCRAFFRRLVTKHKNPRILCQFNNNCNVTGDGRNSCRRCRFERCIRAGMAPDLVLNINQRQERLENMGKTSGLKTPGGRNKLQERVKPESVRSLEAICQSNGVFDLNLSTTKTELDYQPQPSEPYLPHLEDIKLEPLNADSLEDHSKECALFFPTFFKDLAEPMDIKLEPQSPKATSTEQEETGTLPQTPTQETKEDPNNASNELEVETKERELTPVEKTQALVWSKVHQKHKFLNVQSAWKESQEAVRHSIRNSNKLFDNLHNFPFIPLERDLFISHIRILAKFFHKFAISYPDFATGMELPEQLDLLTGNAPLFIAFILAKFFGSGHFQWLFPNLSTLNSGEIDAANPSICFWAINARVELVPDPQNVDRFERLVNSVALSRLEFRHLPIFAQVCLFYNRGESDNKGEKWDRELIQRAFDDGKKMLATQSTLSDQEMDDLFANLSAVSELLNLSASFASNVMALDPNSPSPCSPTSVVGVDAWSVEATFDICEGKYGNLLEMYVQAVDRANNSFDMNEFWLKELVNHLALHTPLDPNYINYLAELSHFRMTTLLRTTKLESWVQAQSQPSDYFCVSEDNAIDKTTLGFALLCAQLSHAPSYTAQIELLAGRDKALMAERVLRRFDERGDFGRLALSDNPDDAVFSLIPKESKVLLFDRLTFTGLLMFFLLASEEDLMAVKERSRSRAGKSLAMPFLEAVKARTRTVRTFGSDEEGKESDEIVSRFVSNFLPFWRVTANFYFPTKLQIKLKNIS